MNYKDYYKDYYIDYYIDYDNLNIILNDIFNFEIISDKNNK